MGIPSRKRIGDYTVSKRVGKIRRGIVRKRFVKGEEGINAPVVGKRVNFRRKRGAVRSRENGSGGVR